MSDSVICADNGSAKESGHLVVSLKMFFHRFLNGEWKDMEVLSESVLKLNCRWSPKTKCQSDDLSEKRLGFVVWKSI